MAKGSITTLENTQLENFKVVRMTEIFQVDTDGKKTSSLGFLSDQNTAAAYAQIQKDAEFHRCQNAFVLTDGNIGFVVATEGIGLLNDDDAKREVREKILSNLTPEAKKVLGL